MTDLFIFSIIVPLYLILFFLLFKVVSIVQPNKNFWKKKSTQYCYIDSGCSMKNLVHSISFFFWFHTSVNLLPRRRTLALRAGCSAALTASRCCLQLLLSFFVYDIFGVVNKFIHTLSII